MKKEITKTARVTCPHCPATEDILAMDTVLYQGFGGYHVEKDGELFYCGDQQSEWEAFKTLNDIEVDAAVAPHARWQVILNNPLRGATWERHDGQWHLIETNLGFA